MVKLNLGGVNSTKYAQEINLDTFDTSGVYFLAKAKCTNAPENANDGIFISYYGSQVGVQLWVSTALNTTTFGAFIRVKSSSTWRSWFRLTLTV